MHKNTSQLAATKALKLEYFIEKYHLCCEQLSLTTLFFCLPIFLFLGAAGQAFGLYVFGWLMPTVFFFKILPPVSLKTARFCLISGICLLGLHLIFPAVNLLRSVAPTHLGTLAAVHTSNFPMTSLLKSQFSSAFFVVGILSTLFGTWCLRNRKSNPLWGSKSLKESFHKGAFTGSILLACYVVLQVTLGLDYRSADYKMLSEHQMSNGFYRAFGFYGHPLSFASATLAIFSFYWLLFWKSLGQKKNYLLMTIALINLFFVFMSGGRTASFFALVLVVCVPLLSLDLKALKRRAIWFFSSVIVCVSAIQLSGTLKRFLEVSDNLLGQDRMIFWKIHTQLFLDAPFLGQGAAWLDNGVRTFAYDRFGFSSLKDKFNAHNIFLEVLADVGIVGSLLICFFVSLLFNIVRRAAEKNFAQALIVAVFANALHGLTQNTFFDSHVTAVYLILFTALLWFEVFLPETSTVEDGEVKVTQKPVFPSESSSL